MDSLPRWLPGTYTAFAPAVLRDHRASGDDEASWDPHFFPSLVTTKSQPRATLRSKD